MAEISSDSGSSHGGKHQKKRAKKLSTRIDMTPMVDLAFLLLTFFVMTSTFNKSKVTELSFPAPPEPNEVPPEVKNGLTFILGENDKIFFYRKELKDTSQVYETNFKKDGIHALLLDLNMPIIDSVNIVKEQYNKGGMPDSTFEKKVKSIRNKREALTVLIKYTEKAKYKNVVDLIDELKLTDISRYVTVDELTPEEKKRLDEKKATGAAPN